MILTKLFCREIAESFGATGMEYFNTFGGNPVSAAIANAVLDVIEKENLLDNATKIGNFLKQEFNRLKGKHAIIGNILFMFMLNSNRKMKCVKIPHTKFMVSR